jgi:hypothetical protein
MANQQTDVRNGRESSHGIERDIDETRNRMDRTVDELEERLQPKHLLDDILAMFRSSGGETSEEMKHHMTSAGKTVMRKVKKNPVPVALIGAGVAWLMFAPEKPQLRRPRRRRRSSDSDYDYEAYYYDEPYAFDDYDDFDDYPYAEPFQEPYGMADEAEDWHVSAEDRDFDDIEGVGPEHHENGHDGKHRIKDRMKGAGSRARSAGRHTMEAGRHRAASAGRAMRNGYGRSRRAVSEGMHEHPLTAGALAFAAGMLAGFLTPETRQEDRLMGQAAGRVRRRARDAGQEAMQRGYDVASHAAGAAMEEAERQGLTPDQLRQKSNRVAQEARNSVREHAREEGLTGDQLRDKAKAVAQSAKESARDEMHHHKDDVKREAGQAKEEAKGEFGKQCP